MRVMAANPGSRRRAVPTWGRVVRRVVLAATVAGFAACAGDRGSDSASEPLGWGAEAVEFFEAHATSLCDQDVYDLARFYEADAVVDFRAVELGGIPGQLREGRSAITSFVDLCLSPDRPLDIEVDRIFLAPTGAVVLERWSGGDGSVPVGYAAVSVIDEGRIASLRYLAPLDTDDDAQVEQVSRLVRDNLDLSIVQTGSIHVGIDADGGIDEMVVVFDGDCALPDARWWSVRDGVVLEEVDYRDVETAPECPDADTLPQGWWTDLALPREPDLIPTASLDVAGTTVALYNSDADRERLARWAFDRFDAQGLTAPRVERIVFEPSRTCDDLAGLAHLSSGDLVVYMCVRDVCGQPDCEQFTIAAELSLLHELAHHWLAQHEPDATTRSRFMDLVDASSWNDAADSWRDRGVEWAAETVAWGLMEQPVDVPRLGFPPCATLREGFLILTGRSEVHPCP